MRGIERRLFLMAAAGWPLAAQQPKWEGTWSASGDARPLRGTWTAAPGESPQVLTGTWTIRDGGNRVAAAGTWSATKSGESWEGHWRALVSRGPGSKGKDGGQVAGSWTAKPPLAATAGFGAALELALKSIVSGEWFVGKRRGAWSIRVHPESSGPF